MDAAVPPARLVRPLALFLCAIAIVFLVGRLTAPGTAPTAPDRRPTSGAPQSYAAAVARLNAVIDGDRDRMRQRGDEWLIQEKFANSLISRARLTGSFDDYAEAQRALDTAFADAPAEAGPHLVQAVLDFGMHRLGRAETMLAAIDHYAVAPEQSDLDEIAQMRADIAFYRGDYARAWDGYRAARTSPIRRAIYLSRTGKPDEALAEIDRAERTSTFATANLLSNFVLMRGSIELRRGAFDKAAAHFDRAARLFPGSWLIAAHRAQMLALAGQLPLAASRLEAIVRASGSPEAMDLLASVYRAQGDYPRSQAVAARAGAIWARRLGQFPEAAYGHAVEHELAFGDPGRALDLARRDFAARPHGATAIALGWAQLAVGDAAGALRTVQPVLVSPWQSVDQHLLAAQALARLGRGAEAKAEEERALALNPHAADGNAALIWFGH